jgi:predicted nucleotidyltransferase
MNIDPRPTLDPDLSQALAALCLRHHVHRLSIFGSGATGNLRKDSDLDFLVEFRELTPSAHADAYFGLLADLEKLFSRRIDLLEQSALGNPFLIRGIERSRRLIYEAA